MKGKLLKMAWHLSAVVRYPVAAVAGMICIVSGGVMMMLNPGALDELLQ